MSLWLQTATQQQLRGICLLPDHADCLQRKLFWGRLAVDLKILVGQWVLKLLVEQVFVQRPLLMNGPKPFDQGFEGMLHKKNRKADRKSFQIVHSSTSNAPPSLLTLEA